MARWKAEEKSRIMVNLESSFKDVPKVVQNKIRKRLVKVLRKETQKIMREANSQQGLRI